jgi:hypothetical protein
MNAAHFRVENMVKQKLLAGVVACFSVFSAPASASDVSGRVLVDLQTSLAEARIDLAASALRAATAELDKKSGLDPCRRASGDEGYHGGV